MPPTLTYPGVYIVEAPSGVHTITGVATSIAAFIGQATQGPINQPIECQTPSDYTRNFGAPIPNNFLGQMVQQFFNNGGSDCFVVRIAGSNLQAGQTAVAASTATLKNVAGAGVLALTAVSLGSWSNNLLVVVDWNTATPDATFNLTTILMNNGVVAQTESLANLSMDPASARYAPTFISQSSVLIDAVLAPGVPASNIGAGYSQFRYPFTSANADAVPGDLQTLINKAYPAGTGSFGISVDGGPVAQVTVSTAAAGNYANFGAFQGYLNGLIKNALGPASNTSATLGNPPDGAGPFFLRLTSGGNNNSSSVTISSGSSNDLSGLLMAGVVQGGIEVPKYSDLRPAPNGITFTGNTATLMDDLAATTVDKIGPITVAGTAISLASLGAAGTPFYKGSTAGDVNGIRENLQAIATLINNAALGWQATVAGYRLMINELRVNSPQDTDPTFAVTAGAGDANAAAFAGGFSNNAAQTTMGGGSDGGNIQASDYVGVEAARSGFWAFDPVTTINLMVIPGDGLSSAQDWNTVRSAAAVYAQNRNAFLLLDAPPGWSKNGNLSAQASDVQIFRANIGGPQEYCAVFYPRVQVNDNGTLRYMGVSGIMAGICAATDSARGVWSAPAGLNAVLTGVTGLEVTLTDKQNGILNPLAVNCLRSFSAGYVNWGARTLGGYDNAPDGDYKYMNVRRMASFLELSLYAGTQWAVFGNNAEPLWAQIRSSITAFMMNLFSQNAFAGTTPSTAFFVKCDSETTTPTDQANGILNVMVGFAPLRPAEFIVITVQQMLPVS